MAGEIGGRVAGPFGLVPLRSARDRFLAPSGNERSQRPHWHVAGFTVLPLST
jgi:hypothetical protein